MCTDRRVCREVAAFEVYQYSLLCGSFIGELECRARLHLRLLRDGSPARDLSDPIRTLCRLLGSLDRAGGLAGFFTGLLATTAAGRNQRSAGGAHP
jgi:hypothetical protein